MLKRLNWENYGDASPLLCGGLWISHDRHNCYNVLRFTNVIDLSEEFNGDFGMFEEMYVDLDDNWINWEEVENFADLIDDDIQKVIAAIDYYGSANFGCEAEYMVKTEEEAIEYLEGKGINII